MPHPSGPPGHYRVHLVLALSSAPGSYWRLSFEQAVLHREPVHKVPPRCAIKAQILVVAPYKTAFSWAMAAVRQRQAN
jgi:hypothetical protein